MSYVYPTSDFQTSTLSGAIVAGANSATIGTGLDIPAANGILQIDYDNLASIGLGADNGPETISYTAYNSGTGALTGITRGLAGTTDVAHDNGATVQLGPSALYLDQLSDEISAISTASDWRSALETWVYASTTTHTNTNTTYSGTFTIAGDKTAKYSAGMKVKFDQTTTKYGIITKVEYSDPNTIVTVFFGTDYSIANAAITNPYYSTSQSPISFPLDPTKWSVILEDTSEDSTATPANGTWYNSVSIDIPLGVWNTDYAALIGFFKGTSTTGDVKATLSTANNSESDATWTTRITGVTNNYDVAANVFKAQTLVLAAADIYYLNYSSTGGTMGENGIYGNLAPTLIRAICSYL